LWCGSPWYVGFASPNGDLTEDVGSYRSPRKPSNETTRVEGYPLYHNSQKYRRTRTVLMMLCSVEFLCPSGVAMLTSFAITPSCFYLLDHCPCYRTVWTAGRSYDFDEGFWLFRLTLNHFRLFHELKHLFSPNHLQFINSLTPKKTSSERI